jgi:hypothetical protein
MDARWDGGGAGEEEGAKELHISNAVGPAVLWGCCDSFVYPYLSLEKLVQTDL